jgi:hypothetical protein
MAYNIESHARFLEACKYNVPVARGVGIQDVVNSCSDGFRLRHDLDDGAPGDVDGKP